MISNDLATHTAAQLNGDKSLYRQVALRISELIEHGTLRPGERVPSVRRCSEQQNVSIATVMQAYRLLESRGVIEARPQSGYYVRRERWVPPPEPEMSRPTARPVEVRVSDLVLQIVRAGRDPNFIRLGATLPPPEMYPFKELNRTLASATLVYRLSYSPLTRQFRLSRGALAQPFDTLGEALATVRTVRGWKVADRAVAEVHDHLLPRVRLRLDTTMLPKPFQVDSLTNHDWALASGWQPVTIVASSQR